LKLDDSRNDETSKFEIVQIVTMNMNEKNMREKFNLSIFSSENFNNKHNYIWM